MDVLILQPEDNVAIALRDLKRNEIIKINHNGKQKEIILQEDIPFGHKLALVPLSVGDEVLKKGTPIGEISKPVQVGRWVHIHNIISRRALCKETQN